MNNSLNSRVILAIECLKYNIKINPARPLKVIKPKGHAVAFVLKRSGKRCGDKLFEYNSDFPGFYPRELLYVRPSPPVSVAVRAALRIVILLYMYIIYVQGISMGSIVPSSFIWR